MGSLRPSMAPRAIQDLLAWQVLVSHEYIPASYLGCGSVLVLAALSKDDRILCATTAHCRCILDATVIRW